jgi:hypothetical protein
MRQSWWENHEQGLRAWYRALCWTFDGWYQRVVLFLGGLDWLAEGWLLGSWLDFYIYILKMLPTKLNEAYTRRSFQLPNWLGAAKPPGRQLAGRRLRVQPHHLRALGPFMKKYHTHILTMCLGPSSPLPPSIRCHFHFNRCLADRDRATGSNRLAMIECNTCCWRVTGHASGGWLMLRRSGRRLRRSLWWLCHWDCLITLGRWGFALPWSWEGSAHLY